MRGERVPNKVKDSSSINKAQIHAVSLAFDLTLRYHWSSHKTGAWVRPGYLLNEPCIPNKCSERNSYYTTSCTSLSDGVALHSEPSCPVRPERNLHFSILHSSDNGLPQCSFYTSIFLLRVFAFTSLYSPGNAFLLNIHTISTHISFGSPAQIFLPCLKCECLEKRYFILFTYLSVVPNTTKLN
jgi:hypothetical protein